MLCNPSLLEKLRGRFPDRDGKRHFLVTEVTHMGKGDVCVVAIDLKTFSITRPLQWNHKNWPYDNTEMGLRPGRIICQKPRYNQDSHGFPHQTEDLQLVDALEFVDTVLSEAQLFRALSPLVDLSIKDIFSDTVIDNRYVRADTKCRSLGSVLLNAKNIRFKVEYGSGRLTIVDGENQYDLKITDLRLWNAVNEARTNEVFTTFKQATDKHHMIIVRVGLARAWSGSSGEFSPKRCYLQVNGVLFQEDAEIAYVA